MKKRLASSPTRKKTIAESGILATVFPVRRRQAGAFPGCFASPLVATLAALQRWARLSVLRGLVDLLAPRRCVVCRSWEVDGRALCGGCRHGVFVPQQTCYYCGLAARVRLPLEGVGSSKKLLPRCEHCLERRWAFDRVVTAARYTGSVRTLVLRFKFHQSSASLAELVGLLHLAVVKESREGAAFCGAWVVVSVPQHWSKTLSRGANPGRGLAQAFAARMGWPYADLLRKRKRTRAQSELGYVERRRNLSGVFVVRKSAVLPRQVLLVDDVVTTGTTASRCARVLKRAGVENVVVLAVGRA